MENKSAVHHPKPTVIEVQPQSPRLTVSTTGSPRKIGIPVDLSDESAYAVSWAVQNYLRPADAVTLLHVRPTSVLYGADWGSTHFTPSPSSDSSTTDEGEISKHKKLEEDFDTLTADKLAQIAQPLADAKVGYKVHVVKDHDMKERLCLEIERLGMSVVIMGSRGFGASSRKTSKGRLGSVSDYCVHHCVCPVVVVRYPDDDSDNASATATATAGASGGSLHPVPEEEVSAAPVVQAESDQVEVPAHDVSKLHLHAD